MTYRHLSKHRKSTREDEQLVAGLGAPALARPTGPEDFRSVMGPPRSQLSEPSCTGFAGCFLAETLRGIRAGRPTGEQFAPRFLWYQERLLEGSQDHDVGATGADTIKVLSTLGVCLETSMPYAEGKFAEPPTPAALNEAGGYALRHPAPVAYHNLEQVDQVLAAQQPILLTVNIYTDLYENCPSNGEVELRENMGPELGGHEVLCVGKRSDGRFIVWFGSWTGFGDGCAVYFTEAYWRTVVFDAFTANLRDD